MKLSISKAAISNLISSVIGVIGNKTTLPILGNIRITAEKASNRISIAATDLDVSIETSTSCEVSESGSITLPAKKLHLIVRESPGETIEFQIEKGKTVCSVTSLSSLFKINGLPTEDFPPISEEKSSLKSIMLSQEALNWAIRVTEYSMSTDESRHTLNGLYFSVDGDEMKIVSTDGRRLAIASIDLDESFSKMSAIFPSMAVRELNRLTKNTGTATLTIGENMMSAKIEGENQNTVIIRSKLVEGSYPNYNQVIPSGNSTSVVFSRNELESAIRRVAMMTSDKSISVNFVFGDGKLILTSNSPEHGEAHEEIACSCKPVFGLAFNPQYFTEALSSLTESEDVTIKIVGNLDPAIVETKNFLYVVMPMRLS